MADATNAGSALSVTDSGWDWDNNSVEVRSGGAAKGQLSPADFIEGGTTLILSGPRLSRDLAGSDLIPIGMLSSVSVSQQKNVQQIFEIGSKLAHIVPGRTMGQMQLGRVFFDGDSLMKALYSGTGNTVDADGKITEGSGVVNGAAAPASTTDGVTTAGKGVASASQVNSGKFAANLASSYFDLPHGLCFMFKDQSGEDVSTIYFEDCMINSHQFSIDSMANIIQEGCSIMFRRIVPIDVESSVSGGTTGPMGVTVGTSE